MFPDLEILLLEIFPYCYDRINWGSRVGQSKESFYNKLQGTVFLTDYEDLVYLLCNFLASCQLFILPLEYWTLLSLSACCTCKVFPGGFIFKEFLK